MFLRQIVHFLPVLAKRACMRIIDRVHGDSPNGKHDICICVCIHITRNFVIEIYMKILSVWAKCADDRYFTDTQPSLEIVVT